MLQTKGIEFNQFPFSALLLHIAITTTHKGIKTMTLFYHDFIHPCRIKSIQYRILTTVCGRFYIVKNNLGHSCVIGMFEIVWC